MAKHVPLLCSLLSTIKEPSVRLELCKVLEAIAQQEEWLVEPVVLLFKLNAMATDSLEVEPDYETRLQVIP